MKYDQEADDYENMIDEKQKIKVLGLEGRAWDQSEITEDNTRQHKTSGDSLPYIVARVEIVLPGSHWTASNAYRILQRKANHN